MDKKIKRAQEALEDPEVLSMLKKLSKLGFGIFIPHQHGESGELVPLSSGNVQVEKDLKVTFMHEKEALTLGAIPIGWMWDDKKRKVCVVSSCCG